MSCAHVWADELTTDAYCLLGCGTDYREWSIEEPSEEEEIEQ